MAKNPVYLELEKALGETIPKDIATYGVLGFTVKDVYAVIVPDETHLYRVVMEDGTFQEIPHKGNCSPTPGLQVEINYDRNNRPFIVGPADASIVAGQTAGAASTGGTSAGQFYIPLHSHERGTGMEFPVDLRLIAQFFVELQGGLTVYVRPSFYYYANQLHYWAGGSISLSSLVPTQASTYKWVGLAFNPVTVELVAVDGPTLNFLNQSLGKEQILNLQFLSQGLIPISAIKLKTGMQNIVEEQLVSLFDILPSSLVQSIEVSLYQKTTTQSISTAWSSLLWDGTYDKLSYLSFGVGQDEFTLLAGTWLLDSFNCLYTQEDSNADDFSFRLYNVTQGEEVYLEENMTGVQSTLMSPTIVPTEFDSNGTDLFSIQLKTTSYSFSRVFPTILKLKKL